MQFQCDVESVWCVVTSIGSDRVQQFKFVIFALCFHASTDKWEENKQQTQLFFLSELITIFEYFQHEIDNTIDCVRQWINQKIN